MSAIAIHVRTVRQAAAVAGRWLAASRSGALGVATAAVLALTTPAQAQDAAAKRDPSTERIVSLGGDATEILYALGLGPQIVAVDTTSLEPPEALQQKPNVGYLRALSAEGVLSMGPTTIIAGSQAGPPEVVNALMAAKLRYVVLPGNEAPDNIAAKIRTVGETFALTKEANALAASVEAAFADVAKRRETVTKTVRVLFILGVNNGRATVGGLETTADTMLRLAGATNAADTIKGYKPLTSEALLSLSPDFVLTMSRADPNSSKAQIESLAGFKETPAGKAGRIVEMDGNYLLGFGPRTPKAALELMRILHPEVAR